MATDDSTTDLQRAIDALRRTLARHPDPDPDPDEARLLAWARGELDPASARDVEGLLESSATLRAYLVELTRPADEDEVEAAVHALLGLDAVEPEGMDLPHDIFSPPAVALEGPFGGLQAAMDAPAPSTRFAPTSRFELILHGGAAIALAVGPDDRVRRLPDAAVSRAPTAQRIAGLTADLFPAPGRWRVGFGRGIAADALDGQRFDGLVARSPDGQWWLAEIDVVEE